MIGTIAVTDYGWYEFLLDRALHEEVNFWRPSAHQSFKADPFSPFLFKLKAPHNAICGFGFFARYSALPVWLAWETFGQANGCPDQPSMLARITRIRKGIDFRSNGDSENVGCIVLVSPVFFPKKHWVRQPSDWPPPNLTNKRYNLEDGEGQRVWSQSLAKRAGPAYAELRGEANEPRYGSPAFISRRLGQGSFRVCVTEAYGRACTITGEHSLPALDAAHIRPYADSGPHDTQNGLLLRADLHRLFDKGYITVTRERRVEISPRLRTDYENGRSYYPLHGNQIFTPRSVSGWPAEAFLEWHNEHKYRH